MQCPYCDPPQDCPVDYGHCHCTCGAETDPVSSSSYFYYGKHIEKGTPKKWRAGHWVRIHGKRTYNELPEKVLQRQARLDRDECPYCGENCEVGIGKCHCGCGRDTHRAKRSYYPRGEFAGLPARYLKSHNQRRLQVDDVREIRYRYATEKVTQQELAEDYEVSKSTITRVLLEDTWKDAGIATREEVEG